jgi:Xaa-Pro dipeptidase
MSIFSRSEIERRWSGLWQSVTDVDCVIARSFHNSYYLSGFPMLPWGRADGALLQGPATEPLARVELPESS